MAIEVGALRALLSLDSAAFEKGSRRAQASMTDLQKRMDQAARKMRAIGRRMSRNVTAPLLAISTVALRSSLKTVDAQSKMAQSLGTSTRSMQVLQRAADRAGLSQGELDQVTLQLTKRLSQAARGGGPAAKSLQELGLSAEALADLDLDQQIAAINTAIAENVPVTEQAAVAATIFGDRAGIMAGRLDPATIAAANQELERFGVTVTEIEADQIEAANDAISGLGLVSRGLANQLAVALAPSLKRMAERLADVGAWFSDLSPGMKRLVAGAAALTAGLGPLAIGLGLVLNGLTPLVGAFGALLSPVGLVVGVLAGVGFAVYQVVQRWDDLTERFPQLQVALDGVLAGAEIFKDGFLAVWNFVRDQVSLTVNGIVALFSGDLSGAINNFGTASENMRDLVSAAFSGLWDLIKPTLEGLADGVVTWATSIPDRVKEGLKELGAKAEQAVSEMGDKLEQAIKGLAADALNWAKELGADIVAGLRRGIEEKWTGFKSWARGLFGSVEDEARDVTETRSPSRAMARVGVDIVDGLQNGMESRRTRLTNATRSLANSVTSVFEDMRDSIGGAIGDTLVGLGGGLSAIKSTFQRGLSGLISTSISSALGGGSSVTAGSGAVGGGGGLITGMLGKALGGFGSGGSILGLGGLGGGTGLLGGLGNALSGGLGNLFSIGANAAAAGGGILASVGAAVPVIGLAAAAFSFFRKKVEELDAGIRVTATGMDALVETFSKTKTTRFWGLSKKIRTSFETAGDEVAEPILRSIAGIGTSVMGFADALQLESDKIANAELQFQISTKDRSEEEIQREIEDKLSGLANVMTNAIIGASTRLLPDEAEIARIDKRIAELQNGAIGGKGGDARAVQEIAKLRQEREAAQTAVVITEVNEEFARLQREGEGSFDTLQRLSGNLSAFNDAARDLGFELQEVSIAGAGAASDLVDLFGSVQGFQAATSAYYGQFYSDAEIARASTERLSEQLRALGVDVMPTTNAQFREMVTAAMQAGDPTLAAGLIQLAPAFAGIGEAAGLLNSAMSSVVDGFYTAQERLTFYSDQAQAAFMAAGQQMPATADAFKIAAQQAASNVAHLSYMVRQGQASLVDLQAAQQRQADLIRLADDAAKVYDVQAEIEADRARAAEEAARALAAAEAARQRAREQAAAEAQRAQQARLADQQRAADAAASAAQQAQDRLSDLFSTLGDGIRQLLGLSEQTSAISVRAAEDVVRSGIASGRYDPAQFQEAVARLSDLNVSSFASFADFQREQLRRASLLAAARAQFGYAAPTPTATAASIGSSAVTLPVAGAADSRVLRRLEDIEGFLRNIASSNKEIENDVRAFTEITVTQANSA